jgi:hypothetical protein
MQKGDVNGRTIEQVLSFMLSLTDPTVPKLKVTA